MPTAQKLLRAFIEAIPDDKITPPQTDSGTLCSNANFRLDVQGVREPHSPPPHIPVLACMLTMALDHKQK